MSEVVKHIASWTAECLSDQEDLFLVDIIQKGSGAMSKVIVLLDGDNGISIDKCVEVSRSISRRLDEELELQEPLTLEVSSPGLDHPLKLDRQYQKNIGKSVKITLLDGSQIEGVLSKADPDHVVLEVLVDKKKKISENRELKLSEINKTIVLVSFK
ncbi:ribosome maturation factor RimP [Reichenbachiella agarivorans]|uniref:Ribosome maturation factor RimP n=1 Tax=Reichenbachiella agarivorans TaxID=2979464 RepID=A0ABY6CUE6_9BACT|nr:ribosome maturation factor RimP [Reichenbachiella agarivorans]UXP33068.1 ribosome maturation factor RimP [Reichenbachiella agarivorans]